VSGSLFSTSWYRVAALTPRLRAHARLSRHRYRGEVSYVMRDLASDRAHRFSLAGHLVIGLMDGRRTVQEIWETAAERLGDDAPTQDEVIRLLAQLHAADVLQCDVTPDIAELLARHERTERGRRLQRWMSPLSIRIPLVDPDRFLAVLAPIARPFFSVPGAIVWLAVIGLGALLAATHWSDLGANFLDRLLAPQHAVLLWLTFPFIKVVHEMGHALAIKVFGGEVHDMGVMLLVLTPVPYVEASGSSSFASKWQRITVGAGGMAVELVVATGALIVWLASEPGLVRTIAYNVVFIAGVSTLAFNANPLLRYDGYYILADFLEIPNLYARSRQYVGYLVDRYLFGHKRLEAPAATAGERAWFVVYAVTSALYRILVTLGIALFVLSVSFYLGLVLLAVTTVPWLVMPLVKGARALVTGPRLAPVRARAIAVTLVLVTAVVVAVAVVPIPFRSRAEGIVWIPDEAFVRPGSDGFIEHVVATPGTRVHRGDVLVVLRDPALTARAEVLAARERELRARYDEQRILDPLKAQIVGEELAYVGRELTRIRERLDGLVVRSGVDGTFVMPLAEGRAGRFAKRGEVLAHVVDVERLVVRTVVPQTEIGLVREQTVAVEVRLAERLAEPQPATIKREVPGGSQELPSPALGFQGGGSVPIDPRDPKGLTAMDRVFQVDLDVAAVSGLVNVGGRVYVRFDHGRASAIDQLYRHLRQLFLARFNV
jgi:putative peptide zinc metalloprotease protein